MQTKIINKDISAMSSTSDQIIREEAVRAKDMVETGYIKLARCLFDIYKHQIDRLWNLVVDHSLSYIHR